MPRKTKTTAAVDKAAQPQFQPSCWSKFIRAGNASRTQRHLPAVQEVGS